MALTILVMLRQQPVVDPVPLAAVLDDAGRAEHAEMPGNVRLGESEGLLEMADAELDVREERDDPKARRIPEGPKEPGHGPNFHGSRVLHMTIRISLYSRSFIRDWPPGSGSEGYIAAAAACLIAPSARALRPAGAGASRRLARSISTGRA